MIRIVRPSDPPKSLSHLHEVTRLTETQMAIAHFESPETQGQKFEFKVYGSDDVKAALVQLFHGKCAYCESQVQFKAIMDAEGKAKSMDIDHWRPKGGVIVEGKLVRGYYWLGAEWTNLLPSCHFCNRPNGLLVHGEAKKKTMGKRNFFPTANDYHAAKPGDEKDETPLLLNPCEDDPDRHLEFTEDGIVREAESPEEASVPKGKHSIEVYALRRKVLIDARMARIKKFEAYVEKARSYIRRMERYPDDPEFYDDYKGEFAQVQNMALETEEYTGMIRQLLRRPSFSLPDPETLKPVVAAVVNPTVPDSRPAAPRVKEFASDATPGGLGYP